MGSGFAALRGGARLAAYIDLKSPYAYLAIEPTRDVARALGVDIDWRPFTLDIPSYLGSAKLSKGSKKVEKSCLLYTSPSPRDRTRSRMPSSA